MSTHNPIIPARLVTEIRQVLEQTRQQIQRAVNAGMVNAYWHVGRLIVEHEQKGAERAEYGKQQLAQLADALQADFGKGFDVSNLRNMRKFFLTFPIQDAVRPELTWTHYRSLMRVENEDARQWYLNEAVEQNWSARALERQVGTLYYERLLSSKERKPVELEAQQQTQALQTNPKAYLRDPYILDFLNLPHESLLESKVEQALINNLQQFLLELGKGFAFVARQQRISCEDRDFYVDLVFYNFKLKCFLLIDLKLGKLNHQDVGQMDTYVRIYDEQRRGEDDNPTIGLILCSEKSEAVAKYSVLVDSEQLFASKYLPYLPSEEELRQELQRERQLITEQQPDISGDPRVDQ